MYDSNKIYEIPISEIYADESFNVRGHIDPTSAVELAKDIANRGLDSPITIQPWDEQPGKKFRILAGHRRFKAHQLIPGLKGVKEFTIPGNEKPNTVRCLVKENVSNIDAHIINLNENIQRENLNVLQEAKGLEIFRSAGWNEQDLANKLGKSRGWVQVRYYLLDLPREIQIEAAAGLFTQAQIRDLWRLDTVEQQMEYTRKIKDKIILGKKRPVNPDSVKVKNQKKVRSPEEIFAIQDIVRDLNNGKNNIITRLLGWAAGLVSDYEAHKALSDWAMASGRFYMIPEGLSDKSTPSDMDLVLKA